MRCEHRRIKKNYPYGKKSVPTMKCKDCGAVIKPYDIQPSPNTRREKR